MNKIEEIFKAWRIAYNPNEAQTELAVERITICNGCEFKAEEPLIHCTVCGCSLKKKIYSPVKGACPKGKWNEIDSKLLTD